MTASRVDATHDPARRSWVTSANTDGIDFPIQNLPLGVFTRRGDGRATVGVAIGNMVLDLALARDAVRWDSDAAAAFDLLRSGDLGALMAAGATPRRALRRALSDALTEGSTWADALGACLVAQRDARMQLPCRIRDYTDFYTGIHHATAVGKLFRPDAPLLPNYPWVPIGYHGRASTIDVSGQSFPRPMGQVKGATDVPSFVACQRLDYELELGVFIAEPNETGERIPIDRAEDHLFGVVLLNDWSARDIQAWEYQPLGPFLSKSFATTISPWVVTMEALAPFRVPFTRPDGDPKPLPYLDGADNRTAGSIDLELETAILTSKMLGDGQAPHVLARSNFRHAYWTLAQLATHHASNGCALAAGDLLGTGTQSGPKPDEAGSLLELTAGGKQPITLPNGETRTFLQDGDTIVMRAFGAKHGARRIGFGECRGKVMPAR
jgi:fumarylacetoacetase